MEEVQIDEKLEQITNQIPNIRDPRQPFHILSILSWMILITSMWPFYKDRFCIWSKIESSITIYSNGKELQSYFPIQMKTEWLSGFVFLITVVGFVIFLIFTTCSKNNDLFNGMFGKNTIFHFIPFIFISAIYFIAGNFDTFEDISFIFDFDDFEIKNIYTDEEKTILKDKFKLNRTLLIFDLIFTILGLISLLVFYCCLELKCPWYMVMAIKNGIFSTFIVLLWYNFFHIIICLRSVVVLIDFTDGKKDIKDLENFFEKTGIAFSIVIGVVVIIFSFRCRDIIMQFVNFLMYVGLVMAYYNKPKETRNDIKDKFNKGADGILDIIIMIASLISIPCTTLLSKNVFN